MSKPTRVVYSREKGVDVYAFGHIRAVNDKRYGIQLTVNTSPQHAHSTPYMNGQEAQFASDCLRAAVGNTAASACAGKSIQELVWDELMTVMERLMTGQEAEDGRDPGRAEGLAYALAVFQNPYLPNVDLIREQTMDRWEQEYADE